MAKSYKTLVFRLRALTNMHPGAGDSFFGAVDKLVQRDPASNRPTIYSHSLKGALREYLEEEVNLDQAVVNRIFGSPVSEKSADKTNPGAYRFFSADLVAIPIPDDDLNSEKAFDLTSSSSALDGCFKKIQLLDADHWGKIAPASLKSKLEEGLSAFTDNPRRFKEAAEELPVVARNCLDNGKSENLWYEELIPRESIFLFAVQSGKTQYEDENKNKIDVTEADFEAFNGALKDKVVQIGANASVGYGYCQISLLKPN